jgi:hypothetical protein
MSILYKLTDADGITSAGFSKERGAVQPQREWGPGVSHTGTGKGGICGPGYIHAYEHPLLAVFFNPIHACIDDPRLWEAEGEIALRDGQIQCGCVRLTTLREIPLPEVTLTQRVAFGILCAREVYTLEIYHNRAWTAWAEKWLSGEDRSIPISGKALAAWEEEARTWAEMTTVLSAEEIESARAEICKALSAQAAMWADAAEEPEEAVAVGSEVMWALNKAREAMWARERASLAAESSVHAAASAESDLNLISLAEAAMEVK